MRPIDADYLCDRLAKCKKRFGNSKYLTWDTAIKLVGKCPTIESEPREWISVDERLPECELVKDIFRRPSEYVSDKVLVCVESSEVDGIHRYVSTDFMRGYTLEEVHWQMTCGYGGTAVYHQTITHWMPLPKPIPKPEPPEMKGETT